MTLNAALDALDADTAMRETMGSTIINVFSVLKRDEVMRYEDTVTDKATREVSRWEIDEYFADY